MALLQVEHVSQQYGDNFTLHDISFAQQQGQKIAIVGETGSGKTTLMKIIGGLGQADSGHVWFEGQPVTGIHEKLMPGHKGIAYLSQHFFLPNHYRVEELLRYANTLSDAQLEELARVCNVRHLFPRLAQTLSGGEKQRVALTRLLTETPRLLLLDEPFSNLDLAHKLQLKKVIDEAGVQLGLTCMMISHDGSDVLPWADEVLVMREGRLLQQGSPLHIYRQPRSEYIAGLFGRYNRVSPALAASLGLPGTDPVFLRPEQFCIATGKEGLSATVQHSSYYGSHYELEVTLQDETIVIYHDSPVEPATIIRIRLL